MNPSTSTRADRRSDFATTGEEHLQVTGLALTRVRGLRGSHKDDEHRQDYVQRAVYPPSITSSLPVTNFASSEAR